MASGGARNRSGPQADPTSGRSERRGLSFDKLPAAGYDGPVPRFPLPERKVWDEYFVDKERVRELDEGATDAVHDRELEMWEWAWSTPQAAAWAQLSESWRLPTVAMWVRTYVICEGDDATAADKSSLHRFADQIGMTPAGLRENGWTIAAAPVEQPASPAPTDEVARKRVRRLTG